MRFKLREVEEIPVIDLKGRLDFDENEEFGGTFTRLAEEGQLGVVLNLNRLSGMSSMGIGILVGCMVRFAKHGGTIVLCHLHERVLRLFEILRLKMLFEVFETEQEAVAAVRRKLQAEV